MEVSKIMLELDAAERRVRNLAEQLRGRTLSSSEATLLLATSRHLASTISQFDALVKSRYHSSADYQSEE